MNGNLEFGATKPLHPNLIDAEVVEGMPQLPTPRLFTDMLYYALESNDNIKIYA